MRIALFGYGKMGKAVEQIAQARDHSVILKTDDASSEDIQAIEQADAVIEFTEPSAAVKNILKCFEAGVPVVVGTTGWYDHLDEIRKKCHARNQCLFYASNFSIGVHLFFKLNSSLASWINALAEYDISLEETHHKHKLDSPSGTAITLAEQIIKHSKTKKCWVKGKTNKSEELGIVSKREGDIPGTHLARYASNTDTITLIHEAKNRRGFATGAVKAAEWVQGKKGVYTMSDLLGI